MGDAAGARQFVRQPALGHSVQCRRPILTSYSAPSADHQPVTGLCARLCAGSGRLFVDLPPDPLRRLVDLHRAQAAAGRLLPSPQPRPPLRRRPPLNAVAAFVGLADLLSDAGGGVGGGDAGGEGAALGGGVEVAEAVAATLVGANSGWAEYPWAVGLTALRVTVEAEAETLSRAKANQAALEAEFEDECVWVRFFFADRGRGAPVKADFGYLLARRLFQNS